MFYTISIDVTVLVFTTLLYLRSHKFQDFVSLTKGSRNKSPPTRIPLGITLPTGKVTKCEDTQNIREI